MILITAPMKESVCDICSRPTGAILLPPSYSVLVRLIGSLADRSPSESRHPTNLLHVSDVSPDREGAGPCPHRVEMARQRRVLMREGVEGDLLFLNKSPDPGGRKVDLVACTAKKKAESIDPAFAENKLQSWSVFNCKCPRHRASLCDRCAFPGT
jgi:hypothetical protein